MLFLYLQFNSMLSVARMANPSAPPFPTVPQQQQPRPATTNNNTDPMLARLVLGLAQDLTSREQAPPPPPGSPSSITAPRDSAIVDAPLHRLNPCVQTEIKTIIDEQAPSSVALEPEGASTVRITMGEGDTNADATVGFSPFSPDQSPPPTTTDDQHHPSTSSQPIRTRTSPLGGVLSTVAAALALRRKQQSESTF